MPNASITIAYMYTHLLCSISTYPYPVSNKAYHVHNVMHEPYYYNYVHTSLA